MSEWIKINTDKDLPKHGEKVIICYDYGNQKDYICTVWFDHNIKYWKLNNIIAWIPQPEFEE